MKNRKYKNIILRASAVFLSQMISFAHLPAVYADERKTPSGISFEDIGAEIEKYVSEKTFASFETSVFCGDEILYTGCFGHADIENDIPADENTVYEWGSITKTFVWVSAMQLRERGMLDLNEDVRNYLPAGFLDGLILANDEI